MKLPFDFGTCIDLEFSGSGPVTNQLTGIGACLRASDGKIIERFRCFPIHLDEGRTWEPGCRAWWDSIPEMKEMARRIDAKENTVSLSDAIRLFVETVQSWYDKYSKLSSSSSDEKTAAAKCAKWAWVTDTSMNDISILNCAIDQVCKIRMSHFFGNVYRDSFNVESWRELALFATGMTKDELKLHSEKPINGNPHDPESDAIYIAESLNFYQKLIKGTPKEPTVPFTSLTNKETYGSF